MTGMTWYYVSRAALSALLALALASGGLAWWVAAVMGLAVFAFFLWAPRSGRYAVHPEAGITALRRDERTQGITDRAARNAFVVTMLVIAGAAIYFGSMPGAAMPIDLLNRVLVLGALTYFASDFWYRRV